MATKEYKLWTGVNVGTGHWKMKWGDRFLERGKQDEGQRYVHTWNVDRTANVPVCLKHMIFQEKWPDLRI